MQNLQIMKVYNTYQVPVMNSTAIGSVKSSCTSQGRFTVITISSSLSMLDTKSLFSFMNYFNRGVLG